MENQTTLVLFNKPFNTLCQFTGEQQDSTLADYININGVYPAGRLDKDSEGLLLLTNNGKLQHQISHPDHKLTKTYLAQVDGKITTQAVTQLARGITLKDGQTKPAKAKIIDIESMDFQLWDRNPPIRYRKNIPTSWIELSIIEGKNRQVRRMTAAVGYPTLRLIRVSIGEWSLDKLQPGEFKLES
ncbi:MAG: pseudouridine synthase [Gammaproteobacteria bacterium]|nr:pseudouridine synthase [Gammaproteobacteria bacterium]